MNSHFSKLSRRSWLGLAAATSVTALSSRPSVASFLLPQTPLPLGQTRNVRDFGADDTGKTYATAAIQKAIDACKPGDTLLIPAGTYLLNDGLILKSDMKVMLSQGALLQANTDAIWLRNRSHILWGKGVQNVTIEGGGVIDGGGLVYKRNKGVHPGRGIQFEESSDITLRNVTVRNIPTFCVDFQQSENLTIDSLTLRGRGFDNLLGSSDGLDIESSVGVRISNCDIEVGDDALCLKSNAGFPCHDIRIQNCVLASTCNAFKIGTSTVADVYDVVVENIVVNKHSNPGQGNPVPTGDCIAAICIESNDHHRTHDITCRNFTINSCYSPIFIALQNRQSIEKGDIGQLDNITIENVNCLKSVTQPVIFNWQPGQPNKIKNVTLTNIIVHNYGEDAGADLSPMSGGYPDANHNGIANAYGIWARGVDGLTLKNCQFTNASGSKREKFVFDSSVENVDMSAIGQ